MYKIPVNTYENNKEEEIMYEIAINNGYNLKQ